ncbi:hypothetical protein Tco_0786900, partial [Tanacetum coccineum]
PSDEQAFWLQTSHTNTDQFASPPVKIKAPRELPKVSMVNTSLKKLKYHLGQFDTMVKKRITPDALTEGEWGVVFNDVNVEMQSSESCVKCLNLDAELLNKQNEYNDLSKLYSQLEKHCISLELTMQLNQEIFQKESFTNNQNALEILEYFENNDLKAQLQAKDTTICKLKEHIKTMRENDKEEKVKYEMDEIETINIELEHNLKHQLQDKVFVITSLRNNIRKLKGKETVENEQADILQGIVEQTKAKQPLDNVLDLACKHTKRIQELLVYVRDTCPNKIKLSEKKVESSKTSDSNTLVLSSTGLKCSTSTCRSQPTCNKKNDKILLKPSSNWKNKVEAQPRKVNKKNRVKEPMCDDNVKHTMLNLNSQLICVKCKQCMFDAHHDVCFLDFVNDVNMHAKSKSKSKKSLVHNIWKPTGKVFTDVGLKWKLTRKLFTLVGNSCPLTRITPKKIVHLKETTSNSVETPKPEIIVYSRRPKQKKSVGSSKKAKIVESKIANNSEPNHLWGSNATEVPSSSSLFNERLSRLFSCIWTPDAQNISQGTTLSS